MEQRQRNLTKLGAAGVLLAAAAVIGVMRWRSTFAAGEDGVRAFMYDESERQLYAAVRDTLPPDAGIGGEPGDGVRAIVVAPRGAASGPAHRRIAYLERYTATLREKLAAVQTAKHAGRGAGVKGPSGDDPLVLKNTLVRRENETAWHDMTSPEARKIITEWTTWQDHSGNRFVVVTP